MIIVEEDILLPYIVSKLVQYWKGVSANSISNVSEMWKGLNTLPIVPSIVLVKDILAYYCSSYPYSCKTILVVTLATSSNTNFTYIVCLQ